jgi:hypothetical protein
LALSPFVLPCSGLSELPGDTGAPRNLCLCVPERPWPWGVGFTDDTPQVQTSILRHSEQAAEVLCRFPSDIRGPLSHP